MDLVKWLVAGAVGGAIGAAVWAAIAYYAHVEIGWIAWAIGGLVGVSVRAASGSDTSDFAGVTAALLAAASVVGGKYAATSMFVDDGIAELSAITQVDDQMAIVWIADQIVEQREGEGKTVEWPEGVTPEEADEESEYPQEIWREAKVRWDNMDADQQAQYKQQVSDYFAGNLETFRAEVQDEAFTESFTPFDLLFFALAIGTAFMIASGRGESDGE